MGVGVGHVGIVAGRGHHDGCLQAVDARRDSGALRSKLDAGRDRPEATAMGVGGLRSRLRLRRGVGGDGKLDRFGEVRLILVASRMFLERERVPHRQPQAMGLAEAIFFPAFGLLDAHDSRCIARRLCRIAPRILKRLQVAVRIAVRGAAAGEELRLGVCEGVVLEGVFSRRHLLARVPEKNMLLVEGRLRRGLVADPRVARNGRVAAAGVAQQQRVAAGLVLVEVVDAEPLHQAMDEIAVGLVVLHAEVERVIVADEPGQVVVGKPEIAKHLLEDLHHRFVLEDAAVRAELQAGDPGDDFQAIDRQVALKPRLPDAAHKPAMVLLPAAGKRGRDGQRLAEQLPEIDVRVLALRLEDPRERLAERFAVLKRSRLERVAAEAAIDDNALEDCRSVGEGTCHSTTIPEKAVRLGGKSVTPRPRVAGS